MSDQQAPGGVLTPNRARTLASVLAGAVLALAGALAGTGGDSPVTITAAPHPGLSAQVAAIETRLAALERRTEEGQQLGQVVADLRGRLDLLLAGARVRLDDGAAPPPRSRR